MSPMTGYPSPEIQWQKNDRILDIDNERVIVKGYDLIINSVDHSDGGTYSCIATNDAGTALAETGKSKSRDIIVLSDRIRPRMTLPH